MSTSRRAALAVAAALLLPLAGCDPDPVESSAPIVWVADDLERSGKRFYVTCEDQADPENDDREISVEVSKQQASAHRKGGPCPSGLLHLVGDDLDGMSVGQNFKPSTTAKPSTTSPTTTGTAPSTRGTTRPPTTTTTKPTKATTTTTTTTTRRTTTTTTTRSR